MTARHGAPESAVKRTLGELSRFTGAGMLNTLLTLAAYQLLLFVMSPAIAYAASWLIGIAFVGILYPGFVFGLRNGGPRVRLGTIAIYAVSFILGLVIVDLSHRHLGLERSSVFLALAVTLTFNFIALKVYLGRHRTSPEARPGPSASRDEL
jgi:putative flippase GtrA